MDRGFVLFIVLLSMGSVVLRVDGSAPGRECTAVDQCAANVCAVNWAILNDCERT